MKVSSWSKFIYFHLFLLFSLGIWWYIFQREENGEKTILKKEEEDIITPYSKTYLQLSPSLQVLPYSNCSYKRSIWNYSSHEASRSLTNDDGQTFQA